MRLDHFPRSSLTFALVRIFVSIGFRESKVICKHVQLRSTMNRSYHQFQLTPRPSRYSGIRKDMVIGSQRGDEI